MTIGLVAQPVAAQASAQDGLRRLLRANQAIVGNLSQPVLLRQTVRAACELVNARYGVLAVTDASGGVEHVVHGMAERPALPPTDRRAGVLRVPVRVRDTEFGTLHLVGRRGRVFSAEDTELVSALAVTAGAAIETARLYEDSRRRQDWLQASSEVSQRLLSADPDLPLGVLRVIAQRAREIGDADIVTLLLPAAGGQRLIVEVAAGDGAAELISTSLPTDATYAGLAFSTGVAILVDDVEEDARHQARRAAVGPVGSVMVLPLGGSERVRGALVVGRRRSRHPFTQVDLEMATAFAHHAALALELADARADRQRVARLEDRDRIARDLHDHVIQRMFAIGLTVQSVAGALDRADERSRRLTHVVRDIDETIRQTRTTVFQLRGPLGPETGTVRSRLLAVVAAASPALGFEPHVRFAGPIDTVVPEPVVDDVIAVLREALSNTTRHARASRVDVEAGVTATELALVVTDDGAGINDTHRRSGLANLRWRAECHGGALVITDGPPDPDDPRHRGTRLRWTIPLP